MFTQYDCRPGSDVLSGVIFGYSGIAIFRGLRSMNELETMPNAPPRPKNQKAINLPGIITALGAVFIAVHIIRTFFLDFRSDEWVLMTFSFIPASYGPVAALLPVPIAGLWSPLTYAFLHADWTHLLVNILWMVAFGSPVAQRLGSLRFIILTLITAVAGAALHYVFYYNDFVPVIGASGAVSGYMGAAARFAFPTAGQRGFKSDGPALSLIESFQNRQFLVFLAVWMVLNFVFGTGIAPLAGEGVQVAW